jgi:ABC-2 type transport system permease protein
MNARWRYLRLLLAFSRFGLAREMAFRGNFLAKVAVEILWLAILLAFYQTVFSKTSMVAGWPEAEYMFFVGCYFALEGVIESLFLGNCLEFAELVRSGDLDFFLLKPIDEQFLVSCRDIDWSTVPNIFLGMAVMTMALAKLHWAFDLWQTASFFVLFVCGTMIAYSFLLMLSSASVWLIRNQNMMEMWWLLTSLMRYPREIFFQQNWAAPIGVVFSFIIPIMLAVSMPASIMVKALAPEMALFTAVAAIALLIVSRRVFRFALGKYRSASS